MDKYPDSSEAIELVHSEKMGNNLNFYQIKFNQFFLFTIGTL